MSKQLPGDGVDRLLPQIRRCFQSTLRLFLSHYLIYYLRVMLRG